MKVDELSLTLRARNAWEAFDLGVALARRTGRDLWLPFVLPYLAFAILVNLACWGMPTLAAAIVWWMKPLFDRIALSVLSGAIFGAAPGWRETLRGLRAIPRTGLLAALTLDRFDFARGFHLPIAQLEGQTGRARTERRKLLDRRTRGQAVWLSVVMIHFIYVLILGFDGLLRLVAPQGVNLGLSLGDLFRPSGDASTRLLAQYLFNAAYLIAECVIEPLYVAAGFTLYLSRRTSLEGWDLEIAFKRLASRVRRAATGNATMLLAAACLGLAPAPDARAQAAAPPAGPSAEKRAIDEILASEDFRETRETTAWRRKGDAPDRETPRFERPDLEGWFKVIGMLAEVARVLAWVVAIAALAWLIALAVRHFGWLRGGFTRHAPYRPDVLFGLDLRPESLPADIAGAARALLAAGDLRGALSLLYRGALSVLVHERHLELRDSDTESECVRRVGRDDAGALPEFFARLTSDWSLAAYSARLPDAAAVARLIEDWPAHFGATRRGVAT